MFLKSLELNGFKSFAQKTILEFPKGITAVVGPNGSGKSNVIDAIRWILGEREAKNLRGAKAEDLIFAGTPKKPRSGMAQVAVNFDNSSNFFPVNFDEVTIAREIARDGNSKYSLNKSEVRAKDIVDFFARARLGTKGITIINQGSSDLFVRVTPQERRQMIEEILGLREYQLKKSETERKLKNTSINLEKVRLMTEEVAPRLRMLKKQVVRYQARDQKREELINAENTYFSHKVVEIKSNFEKNDSDIKSYNAQISEKSKELEILSENLKKIEAATSQKPDASHIKIKENELADKRSQIQREVGKVEARLEFLTALGDKENPDFKKEELIILINDIRSALSEGTKNNDLSQVIQIVKSAISKIDSFFNKPKSQTGQTELKKLEEDKNRLLVQLSSIEAEIRGIRAQEEELTKGLENFNAEFKKAFEIKGDKKEEIRDLENKRNYLNFENEKSDIRLNDLKEEWLKNERTEEEFNNLVPLLNKERLGEVIIPDLERQIFKLRAELMSIGEIDESLIKEANEVETHFNHLTTQSADLEKALIDLSSLIEELKNEIHARFANAFKEINEEFNKFFKLMFGGGSAKLKLKTETLKIKTEESEEENGEDKEEEAEKNMGVEIELNLPKKRINSLDVLSGGEKSLVSIAALFALISVSPPPFLVLDEIDAPLDEKNSKRFADLIKEFAHKVQFIVVTHNRTVMEVADILYGVTMNDDGTSKLLSLKLEDTPTTSH